MCVCMCVCVNIIEMNGIGHLKMSKSNSTHLIIPIQPVEANLWHNFEYLYKRCKI